MPDPNATQRNNHRGETRQAVITRSVDIAPAPKHATAFGIPSAAVTPDGRHGFVGIRVVRELPSHRFARRFLAKRQEDGAPLLLYRLGPWTTLADPATFVDRTFDLRHLRGPGIACIKQSAVANDGGCWLVGGYPGHAKGLITLRDAVNARTGGRLSRHETRAVVEQLLTASDAAHRRGTAHGSITLDDLLLDRKGHIAIELYALEQTLRPTPTDERHTLRNAELVGIARLAYQLLTGRVWPVGASGAAARALLQARAIDQRWRAWLEVALGITPASSHSRQASGQTPGFANASDALEALRRNRITPTLTTPSGPLRWCANLLRTRISRQRASRIAVPTNPPHPDARPKETARRGIRRPRA